MGFRNYFVCLHYCDFLWWNYWICDIHAFANIKVLQYWKWSRSLFWFWNLVSQNHSVVDMSYTPCLETDLREVIVLIPSFSRDLFQNLTVKIFWKLLHICWSCHENESGTLFETRCMSIPLRCPSFSTYSLLQTSHAFTLIPILTHTRFSSYPFTRRSRPLLFPSLPLSVSLFLCAVLFSKFVQPLLWLKLKSDDFCEKK